jgi:hypothetical protein
MGNDDEENANDLFTTLGGATGGSGVRVETAPLLAAGDPAANERRSPPETSVPDAVEEDAGLRIPTRDEARKARAQERDDGFLLPLPYTGGVARVRLLSIVDRATISALPTAIQDELAFELNRKRANGSGAIRGPKAVAEMVSNLGNQEKIANAFCVLGFIKPRLVEREDDLDPDDPYCLLVTDLHIEERTSYLLRSLQVETAQARKLAPFHHS